MIEIHNVTKKHGKMTSVEGVSFTFFESRDVVRHPLVARIVNAYEHREAADKAAKAATTGEQTP